MRINQLKTATLLGLLSGVIVLAGYYLVGNEQGLIIGFIFAAISSFSSWYFSDQAALMAYRAQPITREQAPQLFDLVADLSQKAEISMPKLFVVPTQTPNAFATGRDPQHATIAVTEGIVKQLSVSELRGVIAHELTHVKNRDTLTAAVAGTLAGAIVFLARIMSFGALYGPVTYDSRRNRNAFGALALIIVAPLAATLIQLAISRTREFAADEGTAKITNDPAALARALEKLAAIGQNMPMNGNPAFSPLLIVNPLSKEGLQALFRTHPATEERIKRLLEMTQQPQQQQQKPVLA